MVFAPLSLLLSLAALQGPTPPGLVDTLQAREIGPAVFSGRIVDLALHKNKPNSLWIASASGGLWYSPNRGVTWEALFQQARTTSLGCLALDPNNAEVIWLGTGEANNQRSSYWGSGVYRSENGGKDWQAMGLADSHHIGRIVVDPADSQRVFVAALGHLYTPNEERGVFRSLDGGKNWEKVLFVNADVGAVDVALDPNDGQRLYAATYERRRRAWNFDGAGPGSAIWRSDDGGDHWQRLEGGLPDGEIGRIGLDIHPGTAAASVVYATVSNQNRVLSGELPATGLATKFEGGKLVVQTVEVGSGAQTFGLQAGDVLLRHGDLELDHPFAVLRTLSQEIRHQERELVFMRGNEEQRLVATWDELIKVDADKRPKRQIGGQIYRSSDGGQSWELRNERPTGGSPPYYYGQIRVDPSDSERLYLCSVPFMTSADGGKTWQRIANSVHVDHHAIVVDPLDPEHLLLGNDGGLGVSYDRGRTWDHYGNLPIAQFYAVGLDMSEPYHVYGGTQDNGTWGGPSRGGFGGILNSDWRRVGGGDGFYAQVDPRDPDTVYGESQFGAIYRRDMGSGTSAGIRPPRAAAGLPAHRYNWSSPILISNHNPEIIYFGGNRLFKSYDRGDHWPVVSPDLTTRASDKIAGNVPHCTITTIAESPLDPNLLLVGTDDGKVQRSRDGGLSWDDLSDRFPGLPGSWWVSRVELSRHHRERALVSFTGYREDDFRPFAYLSEDGGDSWVRIAQSLPREPINVVREDPRNPDLLWCGTEFGAWFSLDRGHNWTAIPGLPRVAVHDLAIHPRDREVVLATHGRGMWVIEVAAVQEATLKALAQPRALSKPADLLLARRTFGGGGSGDRHFRGRNPAAGLTLAWHFAAALEKGVSAEVKVINSAGAVLHSTKLEDEEQRTAGMHSMRWNPQQRQGRGGGQRGGRQGRRPTPTPPGEYRVELKVGEEVLSQTFRIKQPGS